VKVLSELILPARLTIPRDAHSPAAVKTILSEFGDQLAV